MTAEQFATAAIVWLIVFALASPLVSRRGRR